MVRRRSRRKFQVGCRAVLTRRSADNDPRLARALDVPVGALCHYVLAKWATQGSGGLLELGPTMTRRLGRICDDAELAGTDAARLEAFRQLQGLISWLQFPLDHPEVYEP